VRARSPIGPKYDKAVNRESAYEMLKAGVGATGASGAGGLGCVGATGAGGATGSSRRSSSDSDRAKADAATPGVGGAINDFLWGTKRRQGMVETMAKQTARTVAANWAGRSFAACSVAFSEDDSRADAREVAMMFDELETDSSEAAHVA
jgi:hypothetical protein